jgi:hypothetical protein
VAFAPAALVSIRLALWTSGFAPDTVSIFRADWYPRSMSSFAWPKSAGETARGSSAGMTMMSASSP